MKNLNGNDYPALPAEILRFVLRTPLEDDGQGDMFLYKADRCGHLSLQKGTANIYKIVGVDAHIDPKRSSETKNTSSELLRNPPSPRGEGFLGVP